MGIQTGPHGLYVVSLVEMELNSVTDYAPIHLLRTMEHPAGDLLIKHVYVPLEYGHQYLYS